MTARRAPLALAALLAAAAASAEPAGTATVAEALAAVRHQGEVRLTTIGRKSGKPHTIPVWFVAEPDRVLLSTLDPTRDWVRNARANPTVRLDFGHVVLEGRLTPVTDPALARHVTDALREKYWMAWMAGLVGKRPAETYVVGDLRALPGP